MAESHAPVRTCIGCRERTSRELLVRVVAVGDEVVRDDECRLPGRGAWLHEDHRCWDLARKRRAIGRALRVPGLQLPS